MNAVEQNKMEALKIARDRRALLNEIIEGCRALTTVNESKISVYDLAYFLAEMGEKIKEEELVAKEALLELRY